MKAKKNIVIIIALAALVAGFLGYNFMKQSSGKTGSATLSWDAVADETVAGYKVYYGTAPRSGDCPPGGYPDSVDAGKETNYVLDKLADGRTYYFSVTSYNAAKKESCFSGEMQKAISVSYVNQLKAKWRELFTFVKF